MLVGNGGNCANPPNKPCRRDDQDHYAHRSVRGKERRHLVAAAAQERSHRQLHSHENCGQPMQGNACLIETAGLSLRLARRPSSDVDTFAHSSHPLRQRVDVALDDKTRELGWLFPGSCPSPSLGHFRVSSPAVK
jgi:hypothetical protein